VKGIYLTKDQHLQGTVDWLVKVSEASDWLYDWWVSEDFRAVSEWNRLIKELVHRYDVEGHVRKT
jgi:hypothetical protein